MKNNYLRFKDLSKKAQMKAKSNFYTAKEIIEDYELLKTKVKVTATYHVKTLGGYNEELVYEYVFDKQGTLLKSKLESRRYL